MRIGVFLMIVASVATIAYNGAAAQMPGPYSNRNDPFADLYRGTLLFHGNYCGPGNRAPLPPIDALDAACARHDICTPDVGLATCACNQRLAYDAERVAQNPREKDDLRALSGAVATGALLLPCKPM